MDTDRYKTFSAEDFIIDKDFRVILNNPFSDKLLGEFVSNFPDRKDEIMMAVNIIKELKIKRYSLSADRKKELWNKLLSNRNGY